MELCDPHELAALARAGDMDAIDRVTRCFGDKLLRVARRSCRSEVEAQDAVQDALLSATRHLGDYRGEGRIDSWLSRMVVNACHRMRRGRKNDDKLHLHDEELASFEDPEIEARRAEAADKLAEALSHLTPTNRALVILADVEGWTSPELAEKTGLSPTAVRIRLSRSRKALRQELEPVFEGSAA